MSSFMLLRFAASQNVNKETGRIVEISLSSLLPVFTSFTRT